MDDGKFASDPIKMSNTFTDLGLSTTVRKVLSVLSILPRVPEQSHTNPVDTFLSCDPLA